jgi:hypothetical protein
MARGPKQVRMISATACVQFPSARHHAANQADEHKAVTADSPCQLGCSGAGQLGLLRPWQPAGLKVARHKCHSDLATVSIRNNQYDSAVPYCPRFAMPLLTYDINLGIGVHCGSVGRLSSALKLQTSYFYSAGWDADNECE